MSLNLTHNFFNEFNPTTPSWKIESNQRNWKLPNVPRLVSFYCINTGTKANRNYTNQQWLDIFNFHRLTRLIIDAKELEKHIDSGSVVGEHIDRRFSTKHDSTRTAVLEKEGSVSNVDTSCHNIIREQ